MYSLFFIAKNNLRKKKNDVIVLLLLIALAAFLFYNSVLVLNGINRVLDTAYEKAHTADMILITDAEEEEKIEEIFLSRKEVSEYEKTQCLYMETDYRKNLSEEKSSYAFYIGAIEDERTISILPDIEKDSITSDAILLPYYLKSSYHLGDCFYMTAGDKEYSFQVAGFVEDPMFATPFNITVYSVYVTRACMEEMIKNTPSLKDQGGICKQYKVRLQAGKSTSEFEEEITAVLTKEIPGMKGLTVNWQVMKNAARMLPYIIMGIIFVFSLLLVIVALIIVRFSIHNFIELNLKNVGILQASGYTVCQLKAVSTMEMGMLALFGIFIGTILGVIGSRQIGNLVGMTLGISWNQKFSLLTALETAGIVFFIVILAAFLSSSMYGKVAVLDALRRGIHTHNFKKNYFPLEKSSMPISIVLSGKNILGEKIKNISIFFMISILSLTTCIGFALYGNFATDAERLLDLLGMESGNIAVYGEELKEAGKEINRFKEVEKVLYHDQINITLTALEKEKTVVCDVWEEPELLQHETIVRGSLPKYDNEIVITTGLAKELDIDIGDVVYVEGEQEKLDYIVSGIDQGIQYMGLKACMNMEGMKRLNGYEAVSELVIYTEAGTAFEDIQDEILESFPKLEITDRESMVAETIAGATGGIAAICIVFVIITFLVVIMVEVLLIHARIIKEQKHYGINKALGYTTIQLMLQSMMTNIPVVALGAATGAVLSLFLLNPIVLFCFSFGIEQSTMKMNPLWPIVTVVGIVFVAVAASFLSSVKIRNIEPVKLLMEE